MYAHLAIDIAHKHKLVLAPGLFALLVDEPKIGAELFRNLGSTLGTSRVGRHDHGVLVIGDLLYNVPDHERSGDQVVLSVAVCRQTHTQKKDRDKPQGCRKSLETVRRASPS